MNRGLKIILVVVVLLFIARAGLYFYNKYWKSGSTDIPAANTQVDQLPRNISREEEVKIKSLADDFVRVYGTYKFGDFSGLESLKDKMTAGLWSAEAEWIKTKKREIENQPKRYIAFSTFVKKTDIVSRVEDRETDVEVSYNQTETRGAVVQGDVTIKYVNEFGEEKPIPPPTETSQKILLKIVKENNEWKVNSIIKLE